MRAIDSVDPVIEPGFNIEEPENGRTETSLPWYKAKPTSSCGSTGSPMRTLAGLDFGTKRTRPGYGQFKLYMWSWRRLTRKCRRDLGHDDIRKGAPEQTRASYRSISTPALPQCGEW
jgi:hypothetical protein